MTSTAIAALRRGRAVDPGRVLTGPLHGVGLSWLEPGGSLRLASDRVEHALYVTAGGGRASTSGADVPLTEGTAVTLPLGGRLTLVAGEGGLEFFHAVLTVTSVPPADPAAPAGPFEPGGPQ